MSIEENKKIALALLESLNSARFLDFLAEDAVHVFPGPEGFPLTGVRTKQDLLKVVDEFFVGWTIPPKHTPIGITAEGDRVAVESVSYGKHEDGREYRNRYHLLFVIRDGKVKEMKEYADTLYASDFLFGKK